jgi:ComF family protein
MFQLLPGRCLLCDVITNRQRDLCIPCEQNLPWLRSSCRLCAVPVHDHVSVCGRCLTEPPPFVSSHAGFTYTWPIDQLIHNFKDHADLPAGRVLSELLVQSLGNSLSNDKPDVIVPVPLHKRKERERGFNQSFEVATRLAKLWRIPIDSKCKRSKPTSDQKLLPISQRLLNVRDAFCTTGTYQGKHLVIVDDVITTTATVRSLSRVLLSAGAESVKTVCLARTPAAH